jgi:hypothetical protein
MSTGGFPGRRRELEDAFFKEHDEELLKAIRQEAASKERKKALADAAGISDEDLLDQLDRHSVCSETVAALSLVPLIAVAWADGVMDAKERNAVLDAAEKEGVVKGHTSHQLLESWLGNKPSRQLLEVWKNYVTALSESLSVSARDALKDDLLGRARTVAEAAGGLLGFGKKVSKSEQVVLADLEEAFG